MGSRVKMSMSARLIFIIAVFMHSAITLLARIIVVVLKDSMEMAYYVTIRMSAKAIYPIAIFMHTAITPLVLITALVLKGSMEMA